MRLSPLTKGLPNWKNAALALLGAILLILAFPDFDCWFLAWFALVPLMWAVEREKESTSRSVLVGWIFGTAFFFGTCWWLTYAPITYAGFPPIVAYLLFFCVAAVAGLFPAMFAGVLSALLRRFGSVAMLAAPFVWVATEFLRYWVTGNNWNALGYSQAFGGQMVQWSSIGGVLLTSFIVLIPGTIFLRIYSSPLWEDAKYHYRLIFSTWEWGWLSAEKSKPTKRLNSHTMAFYVILVPLILILTYSFFATISSLLVPSKPTNSDSGSNVVAIQPNVPMSGLTYEKWQELRRRHVGLAESALANSRENLRSEISNSKSVVIFPESPMNFMYETDAETREFIDGFVRRNDVSVIFNSAEPDADGKFFNSAVMVGPQGGEIAQYDKIYLLPFGESVPAPLRAIVPAFVGSFSYGSEYDLLPLGDAKAGVMICFESHFGELSREYVRNGADVLIEMTNDGYLGPTPVLRQHLANAVFRAAETNRPVLRVTNVGITTYINERGQVLDPAQAYSEDTRVWSVSKSDGSQTLYVRWGDWFAWVCLAVTAGLLIAGFRRRKIITDSSAISA